MFKRNKLAMLVAEFLGAGILTLVVLTIQRSQLGFPYFVGTAAGLAVLVLTLTFASVSGGHFNPALTIGLWTARRVKTLPALTYVIAQVLGGWAAYALYHYFVNINVQQVHQAFSGRIMVAEAIGTMILVLAWSAAVYNRYDATRTAVLAGIGMAAGVIVASAASVGLINPAIAIGARAWDVFGTNGWGNYVLGPILGSIIGVNLYGLLFANTDAPFGGLRRRSASTISTNPVITSAVDEDLDDEDDEDDEEPVIKKPARVTSGARRTSSSAVKVTKARKSTASKVAAKKSR